MSSKRKQYKREIWLSSKRAGLLFPAQTIHENIMRRFQCPAVVTPNAAIVLAATLEYLAENAQQEARKRTKRPKKPLSIKPKDIKRAIPKDLEFNRLLGNVTIPLSNQRLKHTKRMNL